MFALKQVFPGEGRRLAGQQVIQSFIGKRQWPFQLLELEPALTYLARSERQHIHHAAKTGIVRKLIQDRFRLGQTCDRPFDVGGGGEQKLVAIEEIAAVRLSNLWKELGVFLQGLRQLIGRLFGVFGRWRGDDG